MIKESTIERALYVTLLLVFVGVVVVGYFLVNVDTKLNRQIQYHSTELKSIQQVQENLQSGVNTLEQSNNEQTAYIKCIAEFFAQPNRTTVTITDLQGCQLGQINGTTIPVGAPPAISASPKPISSSPTNGSTGSSSQNPTKTSNPTPPSTTPGLFDPITKLLKGIGL